MNVWYVRFINRIVITEKSYIFSFKDTSLDKVALNLLDILLRQNCVEKLTFVLFSLNLKISFPLTNK